MVRRGCSPDGRIKEKRGRETDGTRTRDILDHNQVLYRLSYGLRREQTLAGRPASGNATWTEDHSDTRQTEVSVCAQTHRIVSDSLFFN